MLVNLELTQIEVKRIETKESLEFDLPEETTYLSLHSSNGGPNIGYIKLIPIIKDKVITGYRFISLIQCGSNDLDVTIKDVYLSRISVKYIHNSKQARYRILWQMYPGQDTELSEKNYLVNGALTYLVNKVQTVGYGFYFNHEVPEKEYVDFIDNIFKN